VYFPPYLVGLTRSEATVAIAIAYARQLLVPRISTAFPTGASLAGTYPLWRAKRHCESLGPSLCVIRSKDKEGRKKEENGSVNLINMRWQRKK